MDKFLITCSRLIDMEHHNKRRFHVYDGLGFWRSYETERQAWQAIKSGAYAGDYCKIIDMEINWASYVKGRL